MNFSNSNSSVDHVEGRIAACRRNFYALSNVSLPYPGLTTEVKSYLWKTVCSPVLIHGCSVVNISDASFNKL